MQTQIPHFIMPQILKKVEREKIGGGGIMLLLCLSLCLLFTNITLSIGIPYLLTILVLKFEIVHSTIS